MAPDEHKDGLMNVVGDGFGRHGIRGGEKNVGVKNRCRRIMGDECSPSVLSHRSDERLEEEAGNRDFNV
ncbi:hypothetical protein Nepgr_029344 [Nepenthes gracilis]|uniref:Uncharacterized protein n=1 Tax=Nepenthes gracilis TaxID=150966 RepID=A0AAD3TER8_NEPGR|nr:hypothetical protein Nepgr_029344 [Nepenthes gracilis]